MGTAYRRKAGPFVFFAMLISQPSSSTSAGGWSHGNVNVVTRLPAAPMRTYPLGPKVGTVKSDDASLIKPSEETTQLGSFQPRRSTAAKQRLVGRGPRYAGSHAADPRDRTR